MCPWKWAHASLRETLKTLQKEITVNPWKMFLGSELNSQILKTINCRIFKTNRKNARKTHHVSLIIVWFYPTVISERLVSPLNIALGANRLMMQQSKENQQNNVKSWTKHRLNMVVFVQVGLLKWSDLLFWQLSVLAALNTGQIASFHHMMRNDVSIRSEPPRTYSRSVHRSFHEQRVQYWPWFLSLFYSAL